MIALVTDSNAQLPAELIDRYGVKVIPLTVSIDGTDYLEGVDLDADAFYDRFRDHRPAPVVSTSQPSPGRFASAYSELTGRGAEHILSIHIGSAVSGTVNSARLGAKAADVPVRVVDTGTASFGVGCCVWEAGEALAAGATVEEAAEVAEGLGAVVGNVFTVGALDLARAGGRLAVDVEAPPEAIPVLSLVAGEIKSVGLARDLEEAATVMADYAVLGGHRLRVAVGIADTAAAPLWHALEDRLRAAGEVREVVRYRIGPSVGAHTGPGTAGAFFYPS